MLLSLNKVVKCTVCTISVISDSTDKVDLLVDQFWSELAFVARQNNGIGSIDLADLDNSKVYNY